MKQCKICGVKFAKAAKGPWCHICVGRTLDLLGMKSAAVSRLHNTTEELRGQLREARDAGRGPDTTDLPGPYWGLDLH